MDVDGDTQSGDYGSSQSIEEGRRQTDRQTETKKEGDERRLRMVNDRIHQVLVDGAVAPLSGETFNYRHQGPDRNM